MFNINKNFQRLNKDAVMPYKEGSWYNLLSCNEVYIPPNNKSEIVSTGIAVKIPKGYIGICIINEDLANKYCFHVSDGLKILAGNELHQLDLLIVNQDKGTHVILKNTPFAKLIIIKAKTL